jgi:glycerophosphoryl diester phosphodiesterase
LRATTGWLQTVPIAHRGLHSVHDGHGGALPENSLGAFAAAASNGYAIELDVQLTADDRVVVFHDDNTRRMTGRDQIIARTSFADIAAQTLGTSSYSAPQLVDVLALIDSRVPIMVEVKSGPRRSLLCRQVADELGHYRGEFAVLSFDPRIVGWFRKHAPDIPRGQLGAKSMGGDAPFLVGVLLALMVSNVVTRPDFLAYDVRAVPSWPLRFWRFVLRVPVILWTVRSPQDHTVAASIGANVIFEGELPRPKVRG